MTVLALAAPARAADFRPEKGGEIRVLATTFPVWLLARSVVEGVPSARLDLMLPAAKGCPHDYALTPSDMVKLERADVVIVNGLGLDAFALKALENRPGTPVIDAGAHVDGLLPLAPHEHDDHLEHAGHGGANPHWASSPRRAAQAVRHIGEALAGLDAQNARAYVQNAEAGAARLDELADEFRALGPTLASHRVAAESEVFDYLFEDVGLESVAGLNHEEGQMSASAMLEAIRAIREKKACVVLVEPLFPARVAARVAEGAGVPWRTLDPLVSGPADAPADYYERMMRVNMKTLEQTLGTREHDCL